MTTPRVTPGTRRDVGLFTWLLSRAAGRVTGTGPPHLFLTLGRHRTLFRAWLRFARRLMPAGLLPRRESELVILRVAHLSRSRYEWAHHVPMARRVGVTAEEIDRLTDPAVGTGWSPRERAILTATDELYGRRDLSDEVWQALRSHLDERECIELCLLAGHYAMLAGTIAALRIQPDRVPD